jgi:CubicO group peptidase (beta-lactamase class C family)
MKISNIKKTACAALVTLLASTPLLAETNSEKIVTATESIVSNYLKNDWFAGGVLIKKDGEVLYNKSYGLADIPNKIANTPDTKIRIGSINKHYTAVLILQKVQAGELSLDDKLGKFEFGFTVTFRQLLQHRSGFDDLFNDQYIATYETLLDIDAKIPMLIDKPLLSTPGTEYKYSNYGYIVLGAILEKLEQKPFKQIIENNIFKPLGVTDTHYALTAEVEGKARSYRYYADRPKDDKTDILENVTPDGGMYSTPSDIAAFYSALFYTDKLLDDYHKTVLANYYKTPTKDWAEIANSPTAIWSSYGGAPGVSAAAEVVVKDKLIVVVLANTDGLVAEKISQEIVKAYKGNNT